MHLPVQLTWLIPALPAVAAAVIAAVPARRPGLGAGLALAALAGSLLLALLALAGALAAPAARLTHTFTWFELGHGAIRLGWLLDPLGTLLAVMVAAVGLLIFTFSLGYLRDDPRAKQFFCFLSLFAGAMLGLLLANSLLLLFLCWELVGLASYLLIGFWFQRPAAARAARKAFITTRIGDLGLLLGLVWLQDATGTLLLFDGGRGVLETEALGALAGASTVGGLAVSTAIGLLLFCGAAGKSGQVPLHVWLPDAMEGPTPVSALIHAATMVAAGVFLVARVYPLLAADLALTSVPVHALTVVATVGAVTALFGAAVAVAQDDIKRVLAFSTVSQLGYMMLAAGTGAWTAAIFHLLTHACFKALLFLSAGSVIHATHHEQDIRRLGGLRRRLPVTCATFTIGMMALAGVPFLFSGFWSKEAILHAAHGWSVSALPFHVALAAVALTAFYMTRLLAEVFAGAPRGHGAETAHESPAVMTIPLVLLALASVGLGFLGTPWWPWLQRTLDPAFQPEPGGAGLMAVSIALVAAGILAGWSRYGRLPRTSPEAADPLARSVPRLHRALAARLGCDELYAATFGRLCAALATAATALDRSVWDGSIRLLARLGAYTGLVSRETDEELLNGGFNAAGDGLRAGGRAYSRTQTGDAHGYVWMLAAGFVLLALAVLLGGVR